MTTTISAPTHAAELSRLIAADADVVPFLQSLTQKERFALSPTIHELYCKYEARRRASPLANRLGDYIHGCTYRDRVKVAVVCCCKNITTLRELVNWNTRPVLLNAAVIEQVYPWYRPKWLSKEVDTYRWDDYFELLALQQKGYVRLSDETNMAGLTYAVTRSYAHNHAYQPEVLDRHAITLREHVWLFFETASNIHNQYIYAERGYPGGKAHVWHYTFKWLTETGRLDRMRVLRAALLTATKGFNQALTGWHYQLFEYLEPTEAELLALQPELLTTVQSSVGKAISSGLRYLKNLAALPGFDVDGFVGVAPLLLQSDTKATVRTVLQMVGGAARRQLLSGGEVATLVLPALATADAKLQTRVAKLIARYGDATEALMSEEVGAYADLLNQDSREALVDFLPQITVLEELAPAESYTPLAAANAIAYLKNPEDLIYFFGKALNSDDPLDAELLLVHLPRLHEQMTAELAARMDGLFTQATKYQVWQSDATGAVRMHVARCLNTYGDYLDQLYPGALKGRAAHLAKLRARNHYSGYPTFARGIEKKTSDRLNQHRVIRMLNQLRAGQTLQPLSLLTHGPAWVAPQILAKRLLAHAAAGAAVDLLDWQLALFRLPPAATLTAGTLAQLDRCPQRALVAALRYLLGHGPVQLRTAKDAEAFLPALLLRRDAEGLMRVRQLTGRSLRLETLDFDWAYDAFTHVDQAYDHPARLFFTRFEKRQSFKLLTRRENPPRTLAGRLYQRILNAWQPRNTELAPGFFEQSERNSHHYWQVAPALGSSRVLLAPAYPAFYAADFLRYHVHRSDLEGPTKSLLTGYLEALHATWHRADAHDMVYLLLAVAACCNHKTARQQVGELWIDAVSHAAFDSARLGRMLGKLLNADFAPPKRVTDLLLTLDRLGRRHDTALCKLLAALLPELPDAPITNLRKLLELYGEVRTRTEARELPDSLLPKLGVWRGTKSLQKAVDRLS